MSEILKVQKSLSYLGDSNVLIVSVVICGIFEMFTFMAPIRRSPTLCITIETNTIECNATQCSTTQCNMILCNILPMIQHSIICNSTIRQDKWKTRINNIPDNLRHVSRRRQQSFNCRTKPQRAESFNEKGPRPWGPQAHSLCPWALGPTALGPQSRRNGRH